MFQKYSQKIRIGDKIIDQYSKVYFIAEIGINHEGSILRCKKLIKLAKQSNVDAVKIQLSNPNLNYSKNIKPAPNPYYTLSKYYGNLSIQEYRKLLSKERIFMIVDKPMTKILPELYEENNEIPNVYNNILDKEKKSNTQSVNNNNYLM